MEASSFLALVFNEITRYIFLHTFIIFLHELYVGVCFSCYIYNIRGFIF